MAFLFVKFHKCPYRNKNKHASGSISNPSDNRPGSMTLVDYIISSQQVLLTQVTVALTHTRFWSDNLLVDYLFNYCCGHLMRVTS